ncbi:DUF433 domain-containing protein [Candidatus Acetothermia bacterium]|nr:DUF433 domain-containing protein [Candidatus Acetothermia bacterium]
MAKSTRKLVSEIVVGETYEYYPLGKYIVAAPGVCGGRPTFKYTRLEVAVILDLLASGWSVDQLIYEYMHSHLTPEAIAEAVGLVKKALIKSAAVAQAA